MKKILFVIVAFIWSCYSRADESPIITSVQYWIDNDQVAMINETSQEFDVDCSALPDGLHMLHYRVADNQGRFSQLYEYGFLKAKAVNAADSVQSIQYWIDNDSVAKTENSMSFAIDCSSLRDGLHMLHYRAKDSEGRFSQLYEFGFFKTPKEIKADSILTIQYWIDNDSIATTESNNEFAIDCSALREGLHLLHCRVKDSAGRYSQLHEYGFLKAAKEIVSDSIQSLQYWWDNMKDNAVIAPYTSSEFSLSTNALPYGLHSLNYRVQDNVGRWSESKSHYFYKGEVLDSARIVSYSYWWNDLTEEVTTKELESPAVSLIIEDDLTVPQNARTGYAGHYTATLNISVTDNRGRVAFISSDVEYPDSDAPTTDIDAAAYLGTSKAGVKILWEEKSNDKMGDYNVYVSKDDGPFYLWCADTKETSSAFHGEAGSTYRFTVTGRDAFGNREKYDESKCVSVTFE